MMPADTPGLMWTHSLPIIFAPVNTSTAARPCRRYPSRSSASDTTKYNERRPNIANTFELYTMSGFRVIDNTAFAQAPPVSTARIPARRSASPAATATSARDDRLLNFKGVCLSAWGGDAGPSRGHGVPSRIRGVGPSSARVPGGRTRADSADRVGSVPPRDPQSGHHARRTEEPFVRRRDLAPASAPTREHSSPPTAGGPAIRGFARSCQMGSNYL